MLEVSLAPIQVYFMNSTPAAHPTSADNADRRAERYYVSETSELKMYKYCLPADEKERRR